MTSRDPLRVAVIGCGLMGSHRAREAAAHPRTELSALCDTDEDAATRLAARHGGRVFRKWREALFCTRPDIAVVSTPNMHLMPITVAALELGAHVLVEKPMGKNLEEAQRMARAADRVNRVLKVGFNHRFHPAIRRAQELLMEGSVGRPIFARCTYGHGGRPGYENEWRAAPIQSGGGELLDQGVHVLDLLKWALGSPCSVYAEVANFVWRTEPLEDNAFVLLRYRDGQVATVHMSLTQWMNRFQWQVYGDRGGVEVSGLGGSYGTETLTVYHRDLQGGPPRIHEESYPGPDLSWKQEWGDFVDALEQGRSPSGNAGESVEVMRVLDAIYRSVQERTPLLLSSP